MAGSGSPVLAYKYSCVKVVQRLALSQRDQLFVGPYGFLVQLEFLRDQREVGPGGSV